MKTDIKVIASVAVFAAFVVAALSCASNQSAYNEAYSKTAKTQTVAGDDSGKE